MPSVFTHPVPALALAAGLGKTAIPPRLAVATAFAAVLPDLDVASFLFGVRYAEALGHRGLSHSLVFALAVAAIAFLCAPAFRAKRLAAFFAVLFAVLSHIALDAATNGGLGVAVFWPWDNTRYFLPWQPIEVSPFSPRRLFSARGVKILFSELTWVWLPCFAAAFFIFTLRKNLKQRFV